MQPSNQYPMRIKSLLSFTAFVTLVMSILIAALTSQNLPQTNARIKTAPAENFFSVNENKVIITQNSFYPILFAGF